MLGALRLIEQKKSSRNKRKIHGCIFLHSLLCESCHVISHTDEVAHVEGVKADEMIPPSPSPH